MRNQIASIPAYLLLIVLVSLHLNSGCKKDEHWVDAVVLDFGSPAVDGCGFVLDIGGHIYFPLNLEEKYRVDKMEVKNHYSKLEEMQTCGFPHSGIEYQKISIRGIKVK